MDAVAEAKKEALYKGLQPTILRVCDTLSKYSCILMTLLMTTALLLWLLKVRLRQPRHPRPKVEATVIFSNSSLTQTDEDSEIPARRASRGKIPVRDNHAFRVRQMHAAMKLGKLNLQNASAAKK